MCLSTVYDRSREPQEQLARNVAAVKVRDDGRLILTDIMGVTRELDAELETVDLMENVIYVRTR